MIDEITKKILIMRRKTQQRILMVCTIMSLVMLVIGLIIMFVTKHFNYNHIFAMCIVCLFYVGMYYITLTKKDLNTEEQIELGNLKEDELQASLTQHEIIEQEQTLEDIEQFSKSVEDNPFDIEQQEEELAVSLTKKQTKVKLKDDAELLALRDVLLIDLQEKSSSKTATYEDLATSPILGMLGNNETLDSDHDSLVNNLMELA